MMHFVVWFSVLNFNLFSLLGFVGNLEFSAQPKLGIWESMVRFWSLLRRGSQRLVQAQVPSLDMRKPRELRGGSCSVQLHWFWQAGLCPLAWIMGLIIHEASRFCTAVLVLCCLVYFGFNSRFSVVTFYAGWRVRWPWVQSCPSGNN
jgi:hypothetical protein